jgi:hypothetical protein
MFMTQSKMKYSLDDIGTYVVGVIEKLMIHCIEHPDGYATIAEDPVKVHVLNYFIAQRNSIKKESDLITIVNSLTPEQLAKLSTTGPESGKDFLLRLINL